MEDRGHRFSKGVLTGVLCSLAIVSAIIWGVYVMLSVRGGALKEGTQASGEGLDYGEIEEKLSLLKGVVDSSFLYGEDIDEEAMADGIYKGFIASLGDPYTVYYTEEEYQELMEGSSGEYVGIGVQMSQDLETKLITVIQVFKGSGAEEAGLQVGDEFYSVDGHRTYFAGNVSLYLSRNASQVYDVVVVRDGERVKFDDLRIEPYERVDENGNVSRVYGYALTVTEATFFNTIKYAFYDMIDFVRLVWLGLSDLVTGVFGLEEMAGVVGIVDMINEIGSTTAEQESIRLALIDVGNVVAFIAVNLAVMNMLPIPALDGGRVLFVLLNSVIHLFTRKRIPARYEGYVHAAGMVLLLGLMVVLMYNDIMRLITR